MRFGRQLTAASALAVGLSGVLLAPAASAATASSGGAASSAAAASAEPSCPDLEFVFARGSGEDNDKPAETRYTTGDFGMGDAMHDVYKRVAASAADDGLTVQPYGVPYPALGLDASGGLDVLTGSAASYLKSVELGAHAAAAELERIHSACTTTRVVVGGYSQGAQVVVEAVKAASAEARSSIAAAVLFGDTAFDSSDAASDFSGYAPGLDGYVADGDSWSQTFGTSPVFDYCHNGDPVCGLVRHEVVDGVDYPVRDFAHIVSVAAKSGGASDVFAQHTSYVTAGDSANAAQQLRLVLGLPLRSASAAAPIVHITVPGAVTAGEALTLNAGGTLSDPADPIVQYAWLQAGRTQVAALPTFTMVPMQAGPEPVRLTVTTRSGATARASVLLQVQSPPRAAPAVPGPVTATGSPGSIALSWPAVPGADFYAVRDGKGTLLTAFTALAAGQTTVSWTDIGLQQGERRSYQVVAVNSLGASGTSQTVQAVASVDAASAPAGAQQPTAAGLHPVDPELAWAVGLGLIAVVFAVALFASRRG